MRLQSQASGFETFDVFNAETKPITGLNTSQHPMTLSASVLSNCTNGRIKLGDQGSIIETRGGMTASLGTILASASYRGSFAAFFQGTYTLFVAVYESAVTKIYYSTNGTGWTLLSTAATHLTGNTTVTWAIVNDPFQLPTYANADRLLVSDGTGSVRLFSISVSVAALIANIDSPSVTDYPVEVRTIEEKIVNWQSTPTYTLSDAAKIDFAGSGSSPNKVGLMTIKTAVTVGTTAQVAASTTGTQPGPADRQILIGVETAYPMLWDKLKVTFSGIVLWDPTAPTTTMAPVPIPVDNSNRTIWVFNLPYSIPNPTSFGGPLLFTWVAATAEAPSSNQSVQFFLAAITYGSSLKADGSLGVTYANSTSLQESPGVIYSNYVTDRLSDYGAPILNGLKLPRSPILQAVYCAKVRQPSATAGTAGVNSARFYYKAAGERKHRYIKISTFTGAAGDLQRFLAAPFWGLSSNDVIQEQYDVFIPDAYHIVIPSANSMAFINDRLMVGASGNIKSSFYVSGYKNPFRMRRFTARQNGTVDPDDPVTCAISGGVHQAIKPMSSSILGSDTVFIFMSEGNFVTGGTTSGQLERIARVSKFGTVSPFSIQELNGKIFYLDTEMQVRVLAGGQPQSISRSWIDVALAAIPNTRRKYVSGAVHGDRYYLSYSTSEATTNDRIYVWSDVDNAWIGHDDPPVDCDGLISWFDGTNVKKRLIAFGSAGGNLNAYEYDLSSQSQDLGTTNITVTLATKEWMPSDVNKQWFIGRVGILADDVASGTATHVRTYKTEGGTGTSTAPLTDTGTGQLVKFDSAQTISGSVIGPSYQLSLSISSLAGKRIYRWWCERELRDRRADA